MRLLYVPVFLLIPLLLTTPFGKRSDEPEKTLRFENTHVRVIEYDYSPGDIASEHTHDFPRVVYALDAGVLELLAPGGDPVRVNLTAGQTIWRPAETHTVTNVGAARVRVLETEIK